MKKSWTNGLDADQSKEIRMAFTSSSILRKRLAKLVEDKEQENYKKNISDSDYESPSWAYKKADSIGYARALKEILNLIE